MRRVIIVGLTIVFLFGAIGCGGGQKPSAPTKDGKNAGKPQAAPTGKPPAPPRPQ